MSTTWTVLQAHSSLRRRAFVPLNDGAQFTRVADVVEKAQGTGHDGQVAVKESWDSVEIRKQRYATAGKTNANWVVTTTAPEQV